MGRQFALVLAAAAVGISSVALAQNATKPTTDPAGNGAPQISSPYWNPHGDHGNAEGMDQFGERLMEKTVLAVPQARADAVIAQWQYRRVNNQLNLAADGMRRDMMESEEYTGAMNKLKDAHRDLENARLDALKGMRGTDEYAAIEAFRNSINDQIADERDQDSPSTERLSALAELKMQAIAPVRSAEQEAIENSSAVRDAKNRLIDAAKDVARIEREFAHDVRDSIELADARKAKQDARIQMLASAAYLSEARLARDIAVRYSYLSRMVSQPYGYNRYSNYGGYGYGYHPGYYGGGVATGLNFGNVGRVGYVGNSPFGAGTNAVFGRGGNAFTGPGPGSTSFAPANGGIGNGR